MCMMCSWCSDVHAFVAIITAKFLWSRRWSRGCKSPSDGYQDSLGILARVRENWVVVDCAADGQMREQSLKVSLKKGCDIVRAKVPRVVSETASEKFCVLVREIWVVIECALVGRTVRIMFRRTCGHWRCRCRNIWHVVVDLVVFSLSGGPERIPWGFASSLETVGQLLI